MSLDLNSFSLTYVRPDGKNKDYYAELSAAGRVRLAWECLIRNVEFQRDCDAVFGKKSDPIEIAEKWALFAFKPWNEPFDVNERPRFSDWVRKFSGKKRKPTRRVGMTPNEVAYVLNLKSMADSPDGRKAQFAMLTARLDRELDRFVRKTGRTTNLPKPSRAASEINVHSCLQVADLVLSKVPSDEIKRLVPYLAILVPSVTKSLPGQRVAKDTSGVNTRFDDLQVRAAKLIDSCEFMKLFLPLGSK